MAKPLFHDIVPPDKKSIKKIPIPERSRHEALLSGFHLHLSLNFARHHDQ
jgi:hypothetical protein